VARAGEQIHNSCGHNDYERHNPVLPRNSIRLIVLYKSINGYLVEYRFVTSNKIRNTFSKRIFRIPSNLYGIYISAECRYILDADSKHEWLHVLLSEYCEYDR
jgi:hypothetical protein